MEPLKPEVKNALLKNSPQASPQDVEEYQRLLAERFTIDPDLPGAPETMTQGISRETRLAELYRKLYCPDNL